MSKMSMEELSRYSSSNQDYGSSSLAPQSWNSSKFSNGPTNSSAGIIGKSLNHPGTLSSNLANNATSHSPLQREWRNPESTGPNGVGNSGSGSLKSRSTSYMFDTGEPLGRLSSSIAQAVKTKLTPTREEMKEKLVSSLASDTNIGILPGYKSREFTGGGFHGLRNSQSSTTYRGGAYENEPQQRLPSPVARAQAAIGKTRQEVGAAQDILYGNSNKIAGIYRHPSGDKWVNPSTPGAGSDTMSVRKAKQERYRKELETQMEQSRKKREDELKNEREGQEHPLGSGYNSHSIYTLSMDEPRSSAKGPKPYNSTYTTGKEDSNSNDPKIEPRLSSSSYKPAAEFRKPNIGTASMSSPWLDTKPDASVHESQMTHAQRPSHSNQLPVRPQPSAENIQISSYLAARPPRAPQQQNCLPPGSYYVPPQPGFPYGYSYPAQPPPPQMPFQMYPPPQMPPQQFQPMQYQPQPMYPPNPPFASVAHNPASNYYHSSSPALPRSNSSLDLQFQKERFQSRHKSEHSLSTKRHDAHPSVEYLQDEANDAAMRQHIWQVHSEPLVNILVKESDQLADEEFKKAAYQAALKKQISEKQRQTEAERLKEAKDEEKLEKSIEEYQEKMRKQIEAEQLLIKKKQAGNIDAQEIFDWAKGNAPRKRPPLAPRSKSVACKDKPSRLLQIIQNHDAAKAVEAKAKLDTVGDSSGDNTVKPAEAEILVSELIEKCTSEIDPNVATEGTEIGSGDAANVCKAEVPTAEDIKALTEVDDQYMTDGAAIVFSKIRNALTMELERMERLMEAGTERYVF